MKIYPSAGGIILLGAMAVAALAAEGDAARAKEKVVVVWTPWQSIFASPYGFSRRIDRVQRGTELRVVQTRRGWSRVAYRRGEADRAGWARLAPAPRAGERAAHLGGKASVSDVALALKGVLERLREFIAAARKRPAADAAFRALRDEGLEPRSVREFARQGGLKLPERG